MSSDEQHGFEWYYYVLVFLVLLGISALLFGGHPDVKGNVSVSWKELIVPPVYQNVSQNVSGYQNFSETQSKDEGFILRCAMVNDGGEKIGVD
jgi:hypothetical protein